MGHLQTFLKLAAVMSQYGVYMVTRYIYIVLYMTHNVTIKCLFSPAGSVIAS